MNGSEIMSGIKAQRKDDHRFVKWWRKEDDFVDFDLIDRYEKNLSSTEEICGFDLLTMDEMWIELQRISGTRVKLMHVASGDKVEWVHEGKTGLHKEECTFCPETLLKIYDVETRGNPVDS